MRDNCPHSTILLSLLYNTSLVLSGAPASVAEGRALLARSDHLRHYMLHYIRG
jgi:hypothetical protein